MSLQDYIQLILISRAAHYCKLRHYVRVAKIKMTKKILIAYCTSPMLSENKLLLFS